MTNAEELYQEVLELEKEVLNLRNECREKKLEYRLCSVKRVLSFINDEYRKGRICNLDILLTHCQNKLNGNIDGVELSLSDHYKGITPDEFKEIFDKKNKR